MRPPRHQPHGALQTSPDHRNQGWPDNNPALALRRSPWLRHPAAAQPPRSPARCGSPPAPAPAPERGPRKGKAYRAKRAEDRAPPQFPLGGAGRERAARPRIAAGPSAPLRNPPRPPTHSLPPSLTRRPRTRRGAAAGAMVRGAARKGEPPPSVVLLPRRASECAVAEAAAVARLLGRLPLSPPVCQRSRPVGRVGPPAAAATLMTYCFIFFPPPFG